MCRKRNNQSISGRKKIFFIIFPVFFFLFSFNYAYALPQFNASADIVIGQADMTHNSANQGVAVGANTLNFPSNTYIYDGKLFVSDTNNNRVLIYNSIPTSNNASADIVIGQADMTHNSANQGVAVGANTLQKPEGLLIHNNKLFIADRFNHRVLIYNSIPTSNNASADIVIGQADMTHNSANQGGAVGANTLYQPDSVIVADGKLIVCDVLNHRTLVYNSIPTSNNASADIVIGQADMTHNSGNQGSSPAANTANYPGNAEFDGQRLYIPEYGNSRILIFNSIPTSNNTSADLVIGQLDMTTNDCYTGANGVCGATSIYVSNGIIFTRDYFTYRILIFLGVPTSNNASADAAIGQKNFTDNSANQGGAVGANTLNAGVFVLVNEKKLFDSDRDNNRILIYNLGTSSESLSASSTTNSQSVTLALSATYGKDMMISENADFSDANWETYSTSKNFTLSSGDETKTIYAKFRDFANFEGNTVNCSILLDSTSPAISETSSLSNITLPAGTTEKELTLTTSENATCRYSLNSADSYDSMNQFTATGGTTHSATLSGLTDGNSYVYYLKCRDSAGNEKSQEINFSVASSAYVPVIAVGKNKIYNLSPNETVALRVNNLIFRGKTDDLKKGKIQIFEDGILKKEQNINKRGRWRLNLKRNHQAELHTYQFKFFNSQNQEVLTSNTYNVLIDKINPKFAKNNPKTRKASPGDTISWDVTDNDQIKYYAYTFQGKTYKTNQNSFALPSDLKKGKTWKLKVRAYDRAENRAVRKMRVRVR